ncbi:MAG: DUF4832 domain-containing protein [Anaerolineae bacterium]|nr:DUF4832 domain-containing protein [Anaerolineae bacterium]NUQ02968.1 DUF4832 domain-containing protein [Anaerolineae bacterium]
MRRLLPVALFLLIAAWISVSGAAQEGAPAPTAVVYAADEENFANPERGFYDQETPMWIGEERAPQSVQALRTLRADGISLVRWYFLIDEYRESPLTDEALAYINTQFEAARSAHLKVIPRFAYNFPQSGEYPYQEPDAPLERVLAHIVQLTPILERHSDVIAFMEIGFVGAWGEWHSSTHHLVDEETGVNAASTAIIEALLAALPADRMIAMRYAPYKQQLYGAAPLDDAGAFSTTPQARIGGHNDCFLASETDWGSYPENAAERDAVRRYLNLDNRFVPQGGETCNADAEAQPFIGCQNALSDLELLRFSALNLDYREEVLDGWRAEGCFEEIARRLGYRFRLIDAAIPAAAQPGETFAVPITLINDGFASPYNPRAVELMLRSADDGRIHALPAAEADPRRWLPDGGAFAVTLTAAIPPDLPAGQYEVLLALPDPAPTLHDEPDYAIRLANADLWEPETGYNKLLAFVQVGGS